MRKTITIRSTAHSALSLVVPAGDGVEETALVLNGERGGAPGREGLTDGVDADLFTRWSKANPEHFALADGLLTVVPDAPAPAGAADADGLIAALRAEIAGHEAAAADAAAHLADAVAARDAAAAERDAAQAEAGRLAADLATAKADLDAAHALMAEAAAKAADAAPLAAEPTPDPASAPAAEETADPAPRARRRAASE